LPGRDERAGGHQGARADASTAEDGRADPDEGTFLHDRAVHHGLVSQAHVVVQDRGLTGVGVHAALILDVDLVPDDDVLAVGTQYAAIPDTALGADAHATDHDRAGRDPRGGVDLRGPEGGAADVWPVGGRFRRRVARRVVHVVLPLSWSVSVHLPSWRGGGEVDHSGPVRG